MAFIEVKSPHGYSAGYINTNTIVYFSNYMCGKTKIYLLGNISIEVQGDQEKLIEAIRSAEVTD